MIISNEHGCGSVYYPGMAIKGGAYGHLRSLRVHYDGRFHMCRSSHEVDYRDGKVIWIHNIDPHNFEVANIFHLIQFVLPEGHDLPNLAWYAEIGEKWPGCLKPLHNKEDLDQMFEDLKLKREMCGVVYFQVDNTLEDPDSGELSYTLPYPLVEHKLWDSIEAVHDQAAIIKDAVIELGADVIRKMSAAREIPILSNNFVLPDDFWKAFTS